MRPTMTIGTGQHNHLCLVRVARLVADVFVRAVDGRTDGRTLDAIFCRPHSVATRLKPNRINTTDAIFKCSMENEVSMYLIQFINDFLLL